MKEIKEKIIELAKRMTSSDEHERACAITEIEDDVFIPMMRMKLYEREIEGGIDNKSFFVVIMLKHLMDDIRKQISVDDDGDFSILKENYDIVSELWNGFSVNLGKFILDFFNDGKFSIDEIAGAVESYYSVMHKLNRHYIEKYNLRTT